MKYRFNMTVKDLNVNSVRCFIIICPLSVCVRKIPTFICHNCSIVPPKHSFLPLPFNQVVIVPKLHTNACTLDAAYFIFRVDCMKAEDV